MNRLSRLALGLLLLTAIAPAQTGFTPHQAVVRVHSYSTIEAFLDLWSAQTPGVIVLKSIDARQIYLLELPLGKNELQAELELRAYVNPNPNVVDPARPLMLADLNEDNEASEGSTGTIWFSTNPELDAYLEQFAVDRLGMSGAHQSSTGSGVTIAVIDTGVDETHLAISGAVRSDGWNFVSNSGDVSDLGNGLDDDTDGWIDEMAGHGTFVASLALLTAPDADILPIVALDSETGFSDAFTITQAIYYAVDSGAQVINLSLGSFDKSDLIEEAIHDARTEGAVIVAAAGNYNNRTEVYPASTNDALGVAAVDDQDRKAAFSSYNEELAISAPGVSARAPGGEALPDRAVLGAITTNVDPIAAWDGTSFAAAFVSGAAALLYAQNPQFAASEGAVEAIEDFLKDTAVNIDPLNPAYAGELGAGRLDVEAALVLGRCSACDINGNRTIDLGDLGFLLAQWGFTKTSQGDFFEGDVNFDGIVDLSDLGIMLSRFGDSCQ